MSAEANKAVLAFLSACKDNGLKAEDVHTAFCTAFHITRAEKTVWCVVTNSDLTEGRGYQYVKHVCELEATAIRLAKKAGVMGSDASVQAMKAYRIGLVWFYPSTPESGTRQDVYANEHLQARKGALERAKALGMADADIALLQKGGE